MFESDPIPLCDPGPERGSDVHAGTTPIADISGLICRTLSVYLSANQAAMSEKLGLTLAELKALEIVQEFDALPTGQLAQLLGISWGGTTALINRLEATGYVERSRHPLDRRVIVIRPVAARCAALERERRALAEEVAFVGRQFDAQQLRVVQSFLDQCARAFRHDTQAWLQSRHALDLDN
ncbi:MarR family winged helix-turn-helix transcriptional regulator [Bordetella sp. 2513F-2]